MSKDRLRFDTFSINSDNGSVSSETSVSTALRELKDLMNTMQQRNDIQDGKLRDLDNKIFSMECNKSSNTDTKIISNYDNTNELKWETKKQSERIGNLERKMKVLEESLEEEMDQSSLEIMEDATNIQQLFHDHNNFGTIKTQIKALKNGILLLLENFDHIPEVENLLREIYNASFGEAQDLLTNNFSAVQKVFMSVSFTPEIETETENEEEEDDDDEEEEEEKEKEEEEEEAEEEEDFESSSEENESQNPDYESAEETQSDYSTAKEIEANDSN